jgi:2',3'-cyclic-nucleotide 2'-phosphodiesterase/3'-nucleotidase
VLSTTDIHGCLLAYDYFADQPASDHSLTRTASLIEQQRASSKNTLLFDNGDFLQGTPLADTYAQPPFDDHIPNPIIKAMNHLGYDAAALGNHEFNYGLPVLNRATQQAKFPVLCANLASPGPKIDGPSLDQITFQPYAMLDRTVTDTKGVPHKLRIGVFGVLPAQTTQWEQSRLAGQVISFDPLVTAKRITQEMRAAGADLVIALSHSGIDTTAPHPFMENTSLHIAAIDGIDAVICGHTHQVFPGPGHPPSPDIDAELGTLHGKPAVMAGHSGSHLGQIDLTLHLTAGGWRVADHTSRALPVMTRTPEGAPDHITPEDIPLRDLLLEEHQTTLNRVRRPVGSINHAVHSYFTLLQDDSSVRLVGAAQRAFVEKRLASGPYADLPILSAAPPFKCGGRSGPANYTDIPKGKIALRHVADLHSFPNEIRALLLSAEQVTDWLEMSASMFQQIIPGQPDQLLQNHAFPSYNFDVVHGLTYQIDLSQPPRFTPEGHVANPNASRICHMRLNDRPVRPQQQFIMATNSYRASGGGSFPHASQKHLALSEPVLIRDILVDFLQETADTDPNITPAWRFLPMPKTSVLLDTGPRARDNVTRPPGLHLEEVGTQPNGFLRYRAHLGVTGSAATLASAQNSDYIDA